MPGHGHHGINEQDRELILGKFLIQVRIKPDAARNKPVRAPFPRCQAA